MLTRHGTAYLLEGAHAPVHTEVTAAGLPVAGRLPAELDGVFARIGPNPLRRPDPARHHALSGDGMVHAIRLRGGDVRSYRNRWIRSDGVCRALGEMPVAGPRYGLCDTVNANLIRFRGRLLALGDGGALPVELDDDLDSVARVDFDGTLPGGFSAHPQCDPVTGELHAVAYEHDKPFATYLVVDVYGRVRKAETIPLSKASMMHAFSLTERYAILYDLPVTYDPRAAAAGSRVPYTWDDDHGARIGLLPRDGSAGDIRWFEVEPCYVFHCFNAYEDGGRVVLDVVRHDRAFDKDPLAPGEAVPAPWRWTLDPETGRVQETRLDDEAMEFPRIDDRYRGTRHRYGFATVMRRDAGGAFGGPALVRYDFATGASEYCGFGPGREVGEAVFVPRGHDAAEGDGWLLAFVNDIVEDCGGFVVVDTADLAAGPVASVQLPARVPHGFHAIWLPRGC